MCVYNVYAQRPPIFTYCYRLYLTMHLLIYIYLSTKYIHIYACIETYPDIGVCFCGSPIIGEDLVRNCQKHSNYKDKISFTLHKENF